MTQLLKGTAALVLLSCGGAEDGTLSEEVGTVRSGLTEADALTSFNIMASHGYDYARIRVLVQPPGTHGLYQDIPYLVRSAKAAKLRGMKVYVKIFMSDWWVDPGQYWKPESWSSNLSTEIYNHTMTVLNAMYDAGVPPDMVGCGNENNSGVAGSTDKTLLNNCFNAVQDFETAKADIDNIPVTVHYAGFDFGSWFNGLSFDHPAISAYLMWHGGPSAAGNAVDTLYSQYGKKVVLDETAMYHATSPAGESTSGYAQTEAGQQQFLTDYGNMIHGRASKIKGAFYWGAMWAQQEDWIISDSGWSNDDAEKRSLFKSQNALEAVLTTGASAWQTAGLGLNADGVALGFDGSEALQAENHGVLFIDPSTPSCGDSVCNGSETCSTCAADCGACATCGDGSCNGTETCSTCAADCEACPTCGDGTCNGTETCSACAADCGACPTYTSANINTQSGTTTESGGTFTIEGEGTDIFGTTDELRFVYRAFTGDGSMIAKVVSVENTNSWAKAAVMIRSGLTGGSKYALLMQAPDKKLQLQWRATDNQSVTTSQQVNVSAQASFSWLKLTKTGNTFTAYYSANGTSWTQIGTAQTIDMGTGTLYGGLAVCSHVNENLCTAVFSDVTWAGTPACTCADDGNPCTADACDGSGVCQHTAGNAGAACRASVGVCDVAETCTGSSTTCPADGFAASGTQCRASIGTCDAAESCTGSSATCPADSFAGSGTQCRAAAGVCDVAESCTGNSATCPANGFVASGTQCRTSGGVCDVAENCTGSSATCPTDAFASSATQCRASAGSCDAAENCTGASASCPGDGYAASGASCDDSNADTCNDVCNGSGTCAGGSCTNQAPAVSISSPSNGATFTAPASVTINATATDIDGTISKVEFYNGTTLLATDTVSPYSYTWSSVAAGTYSLTAKAYDNASATSTSTVASITVSCSSPAAPASPAATAGNAQVALTWTTVSGATSYTVRRATTSGGPYTDVATGVTSTSYTNIGLTNGTTYYYVVTAVNACGAGTNSSQVSATPVAASNPCAAYCSNPTVFASANYNSGNIGTAATCHQTTATLTAGNCGNFAAGRTLKINGTTLTCNGSNWTPPAKVNGGYCIYSTSGNYSYAYFNTW